MEQNSKVDSTHALFEQGKGVISVADQTGMSLSDVQWRYRVWSEGKKDRRIADLERENERLRGVIVRLTEAR